jgi:hypothetical protein
MGEAQRRMEMGGPQFHQLKPGQQIQVDLKNAVPKVCECGGKYFQPAVMLFTVSALLSPTGQELMAQQPVLICLDCKKTI